jgi:uncharacterized protein YukE
MASNLSQYDQQGYTGASNAHGAAIEEHHGQLNTLQGHLDTLRGGYQGDAANIHHNGWQDFIEKGRGLVNTMTKIQELTNATNTTFSNGFQDTVHNANQLQNTSASLHTGLHGL